MHVSPARIHQTQALGCLLMGILSHAAVFADGVKVDPKTKVDFNRDIRPILSQNCYACHGPDANKRKAGLRLDMKESVFGKAKSGAIAVVPGAPEKSEMIRRLTTKDPDDVMPPAKEDKALKPPQ